MRTIRYARSWKAGADVETEETEFERDGARVRATLILPARRSAPLPAWVALGGISRMGRFHPQLMRFAKALASSGVAVVVPEIPEWRRLQVAPGPAAPTIRGCLDLLHAHPEVRPGKVGLIGFSFGAPQVAIAAAREDLAQHIAGIVLFGAYCSLERTLGCQFTGRHEWEGVDHELDPDPYGRWVVGSNHLTDVPGYEDAGDVARALHRLAVAASDERISAWEPYHDQMIGELRVALPERRRPLFDLFATATGATRPDGEECFQLAKELASACRRVEPRLEPMPFLEAVEVPTRLIHGRGDRLIPFTECLRLSDRLPSASRQGRTVTGLFSHSADRSVASPVAHAWETVTFFETLRGLINMVPATSAAAAWRNTAPFGQYPSAASSSVEIPGFPPPDGR